MSISRYDWHKSSSPRLSNDGDWCNFHEATANYIALEKKYDALKQTIMTDRLETLEQKIDNILGMLDNADPWYTTIPDVGVRCWLDDGKIRERHTYVVIAYHEGEERPFEIKNPCPGIWYGSTRWKNAIPINSVF
jgi:hypothetical protein